MAEPLGDCIRITTPLLGRPREVHAYLVPLDAGGWMLVDGGLDTDDAWAALRSGVEGVADWSDLEVHFVTHMHLDHMGLVQKVRDASSVPLVMGQLDAERAAHASAEPAEEDDYREGLLRRCGAPESVREAVRDGSRRSRKLTSFVSIDHALPMPVSHVPGAPEWTAVWTPGHTAGHTSLFRERDGCLIAGDAVLPTISPTIGVNRQRADPISDYLQALDRLEALRPRLILAGHGPPLEGTGRIAELRREVVDEGERVRNLLSTNPATAWDLSGRRYADRDLPLTSRVQALRETLAHLDHLAATGLADKAEDSVPVHYQLA